MTAVTISHGHKSVLTHRRAVIPMRNLTVFGEAMCHGRPHGYQAYVSVGFRIVSSKSVCVQGSGVVRASVICTVRRILRRKLPVVIARNVYFHVYPLSGSASLNEKVVVVFKVSGRACSIPAQSFLTAGSFSIILYVASLIITIFSIQELYFVRLGPLSPEMGPLALEQ